MSMSQGVKRLIAVTLIGGVAVGGIGCDESTALEQGSTGSAVVSTGFTDEAIASGITSPTAMTVAPDGRVFVSQQAGQLRVITNASPPQLLPTPFLTVNTTANGERGLVGVAFDPDFAANRFVYAYYTSSTPAPHNRVSRFTASESNPNVVEAGSEVVLLELDDLSSSVNHNGGAIHFGPEGKLYVAVGDNLDGDNAQAPTNLFGKVLRINPDGSIPTDNPFLDRTSGVYGSIWAIGLRNPFTFAFQRGTGRMFLNDVGESTWEEIDDGIAGSNYGWPQTEGATTQAGIRAPLFTYGHGRTTTTGCAITGGAFYNPVKAQFPSAYLGKYFFADYCSGWIRVLDPSSGTATGFATGLSSPIDLQVTDDGALWYLQHDGQVRRIRVADTRAPSAPADLAWSNDGMTVTLSWQASTDDVGVTGYELYYGLFDLGAFAQTSVDLIGFKVGTPYTFAVKARDAAGNLSAASNQVTVLLGLARDTTPPSAPTGLSASNVTDTSLTLRWTASTDDVAVVLYQVYAGGALKATTVGSTSAALSGLAANTSYSLTVKALDAAENASEPSAALTVKTGYP